MIVSNDKQENVKPKDFLKPFTTGVHSYHEESSFLQEDIGVPISKSEFDSLFKKITSIPNFLNENKAPILKSIYDDMKVVCDHFQPLYDLGLKNLVIDLTGGAVRDFVLNRHNEIKDIDVMISYNYSATENQYNLMQVTKDKLLNSGFTEKELLAIKWEDAPDEYLESKNPKLLDNHQEVFFEFPEEVFNSHLNRLVCLCLNRFQGDKQNFLHGEKDMILEKIPTNDPNYDKSIRERLTGVIKIKGSALKFPTDILITNKSKFEFMQGFDINLCKASFCFINKMYNSNFPKDYSHLISRFSSCMDFFADIHNKKMTFVVDDRADISIDATLRRFDKFKEKYPEYEPNITLFYTTDFNYQKLHYAKASYLKRNIESSLDMNNKPKKHKIKI